MRGRGDVNLAIAPKEKNTSGEKKTTRQRFQRKKAYYTQPKKKPSDDKLQIRLILIES